jgi:hypothetical protein
MVYYEVLVTYWSWNCSDKKSPLSGIDFPDGLLSATGCIFPKSKPFPLPYRTSVGSSDHGEQ